MNSNKSIKTISVIILVLFVAVICIVSLTLSISKNDGGDNDSDRYDDVRHEASMTKEEAEAEFERMAAEVEPSYPEPVKSSVDLSQAELANEVPSIEEYPLSVEGGGEVDIEIFATSEKSGKDKDGWINDVAELFNDEHYMTKSGRSMSVSIRPMASGLGADYIISKVHLPAAYTPSNELFGAITLAQGGEIELVTDTLVKNTAGILVSGDIESKIKSKYDEVSMQTVIRATEDNVIAMGYTNPLSSATGLNFLVSTLYSYDAKNILSDEAVKGFRDFQLNVPYVAYTTLQMRESAKSGSLDGMVMEYQSYINDEELKENYSFIPFGIEHNNPLYSVGKLTDDEKEVLEAFADYCKSEQAQSIAEDYGFNQMNYTPEVDISGLTNRDISDAQALWKENKDLGKEIIAVFVADVSGSMDGEPIMQLKQSLVNGAKYIGDNVQVGIVSYSDEVFINLPIAKFDLNQRAYFQGAVESLMASGGTASYDAVAVAADMLIKAKQEQPDAKIMLFLLSDGQANIGYDLEEIRGCVDASNIPVYTIAYGEGADTEELSDLSSINEAAAINASSDDVIYKIKSLFNSEM